MPDGKVTNKSMGRLAQQLLFSEALQYKRAPSPAVGHQLPSAPALPPVMSDKEQPTTMDRILQEITAVSRRIQGMDASLTVATKSMRSEIAGFQSRVTGLEHQMGSLESHMTTAQDKDQDLHYLRSKITDLEDRTKIFGFPENEEGPVLLKMTLLTFDLPLEFQRAHRVGLKRLDGASRPRPIIAYLLRHGQARQLLQAARTHCPFQMDEYAVRIRADYSKDTNERQNAFLAL
ncbi:hypothetical protein NDU88_006167 [Pleurodeles waltl]|uniref:Transposase element L1Md-A101/L1Md-A102/L1Md-A2 n=1 Tax=Pleurodeles waltl TaxID=8319 RepID=A0AAV7RLQ8_PLEWA|nr:hypothetical protein NDU88_006167 [Pleurodeles waltl]